MPLTSSSKEAQENRRTDARDRTSIGYMKDVLSRAHLIKTGRTPGTGRKIEALEFSSQKAKAVKLSKYSFPIFVIHKSRNDNNGRVSTNVGRSAIYIRKDDELE